MNYNASCGKYLFALLIQFLTFSSLTSQSNGVAVNLPPAPQAAAMAKLEEVPVGEYSGTFNYSVPLYTGQYKSLSIPIGISYQSGGITVDQEATQVGLGWNLQAGGVITRALRGGDDFGIGAASFLPPFSGYYALATQGLLPPAPGPYNWLYPVLGNTLAWLECDYDLSCFDTPYDGEDFCPIGTKDMESDLYTYNFLGQSGQFFIDKQGNCVPLEAQDILIEMIGSGGLDTRWKITTNDGVSYFFGLVENSRQWTFTKSVTYASENDLPHANVPPDGFSANEWIRYTSAWYLDKVVLPGKVHTSSGSSTWVDDIAAEFTYTKTTGEGNRVKTIPKFTEEDWEKTKCEVNAPSSGSCSSAPPSLFFASNTRTMHVQEYEEVLLANVDFNYGEIDFTYSARTDLIGAQKLDNIQIKHRKNGASSDYKRIDFSYTYRQSASVPAANLWHNFFSQSGTVTNYINPNGSSNLTQRLYLQSVRDMGNNSDPLPPYEFTYEAKLLPPKTSMATDAWGYYNGETDNTQLVPYQYYPGICVNGTTTDLELPGADRSVQEEFARAGHLMKVKHPLGAETTFGLENNRHYVGDYEQ